MFFNCNITVFNNLFNSILQLKIAKVNLFYEKTTIQLQNAIDFD